MLAIVHNRRSGRGSRSYIRRLPVVTTWSSAYRDGDGQTIEVTSNLPRFEDAEAELRMKVANDGGSGPLYFRDDRSTHA